MITTQHRTRPACSTLPAGCRPFSLISRRPLQLATSLPGFLHRRRPHTCPRGRPGASQHHSVHAAHSSHPSGARCRRSTLCHGLDSSAHGDPAGGADGSGKGDQAGDQHKSSVPDAASGSHTDSASEAVQIRSDQAEPPELAVGRPPDGALQTDESLLASTDPAIKFTTVESQRNSDKPTKRSRQAKRVAQYNQHAAADDMAKRARSTATGLYKAAVDKGGSHRRSVPLFRSLREVVVALRTSPWLAVWLICGMFGLLVYFSDSSDGAPGKGPLSPLLLAASVLGVTTTKAKAGVASASAVGATWRASGAAGIISFYIRSVFAGKRIRVVRYPDSQSEDIGLEPCRMSTMTVWNASARLLQQRIAQKNGFYASDIHMFHWTTPGVFERIPEDGDLMLVPEAGYIVWAPIEVSVPVRGPLYPEADTGKSAKGAPVDADSRVEALLLDIAGMECDEQAEARLAELALAGDEKLMGIHAAFGSGKDPDRFSIYAMALLRVSDALESE